MAPEEPDYLKALREDRERRQSETTSQEASKFAKAPASPAEREAVRWAREVAGKHFTVAPSLTGARCAILIQPMSILGATRPTLEGSVDREALAQRVKVAAGAGEKVLGCYEITTGRPLAVSLEGGKPVFTPGQPRSIPKAASPEEMIRRATAQAEQRAKARKTGDKRGNRGR